jgi:4-amino-4-deoxy-L-arabinose transferase-like glycosyltransferase
MPAQGESLPPRRSADDLEFVPRWLSRPLVRMFFWMATATVGLAQAWSLRFTLSRDGNNYLEIATAYLRGDFAHAIDAYWSPMYSWLIAVILRGLNPPGAWETTLLHLLNLVGLLVALRCFEYFFEAFLAFFKHSGDSQDEMVMSESLWWLLGYGLFFSTSLFVLTLEPTTPDMWLCVFTYLAMGILLRIAMRPEKTVYFALLGLVLGLGYLTKSFYFPLAFVFLLVAGLSARTSRRYFAHVLLSALVFAIVSGPFIFAISKDKHRITFGDAGKITYAEWANQIMQPQLWQGDSQSGVPKHPTRKILSNPSVFEFAGPAGESRPPYDLSYWMDGVRPHFNVRGQLRILRQSAGTFFVIFLVQLEFAVGFLVLWIFQEKSKESFYSVARLWPLWVPPLAACAAYSLVLVEARYVAPFLVFLWLAGFIGVTRVSSTSSRRIIFAVVLGILAVTGIKTAKYFVSDLAAVPNQTNEYWQVARSLHEFGIQPGDKIAVIAGTAGAHWARLASVQIVAELPYGQDDIFWRVDRATQDRVYAAFASTGSRAVVVKDPPPDVTRDDWHRLGDTPYYARFLPKSP